MLKFLIVPVIMVCAVGGTTGILKVISKAAPGRFQQTPDEEQDSTIDGR